MSISTEELIAINGLLIEREGAFARVGDIEQSINQLLGADYPFETPEAIPPSRQKRKPVKRAKAAKAKVVGPPKLRRLKPGECAYRFTWQNKSGTHSSEATDLKAADALVKHPLPGTKLAKVETLDLEATVVECIYES